MEDKNDKKKASVTNLNDFRENKLMKKIPALSGLPAEDKQSDPYLTTRNALSHIDYSFGNGNAQDTNDTTPEDDLAHFTPHHLQSLTAFFEEGKNKGVFHSFDFDKKEDYSRFIIHGAKNDTPLRVTFMALSCPEKPVSFVGGIGKETVCKETYAVFRGIINTETEVRKRFLS